MCKSVKGAVFFGSSIQVVAAFVFFVWFLFDTVISEMGINLWKCNPPDVEPGKNVNTIVHYLNLLFKFIYYIAMFVTGIYIFRGVERAAPKMIKYALLVFVIVQLISLAIFIAISFTYYEDRPIESYSDFMGTISSRHESQPLMLIGSSENGSCTKNEGEMNITSIISILEESEESIFDDGIIPVLESPLTSSTTSTTPMSFTIETTEVTIADPDSNPNTSVIPLVPTITIHKGTPAHSTQKLSHNQLVSFVFQIFLVGFNSVGTAIYTTVLLIYLLTL